MTWLDKFAKSEIDFGFGHLYRLQCKKCHDPLCTRILIRYEFDKRGNYLYRDCEKITEHQFTAIKDIKDKLNVG